MNSNAGHARPAATAELTPLAAARPLKPIGEMPLPRAGEPPMLRRHGVFYALFGGARVLTPRCCLTRARPPALTGISKKLASANGSGGGRAARSGESSGRPPRRDATARFPLAASVRPFSPCGGTSTATRPPPAFGPRITMPSSPFGTSETLLPAAFAFASPPLPCDAVEAGIVFSMRRPTTRRGAAARFAFAPASAGEMRGGCARARVAVVFDAKRPLARALCGVVALKKLRVLTPAGVASEASAARMLRAAGVCDCGRRRRAGVAVVEAAGGGEGGERFCRVAVGRDGGVRGVQRRCGWQSSNDRGEGDDLRFRERHGER